MKYACRTERLSLPVLALLFCSPALGQWSTGSPLPRQTWNSGAERLGHKIVVAAYGPLSASPACEIYDTQTGAWTLVQAPIPHAFFPSGAAAVVGTKFFIAPHAIPPGGSLVNEVMVYDDSTGVFSSTGHQLSGDCATAVGTKALFAHGFAAVDIYDDALGTWSTAALSDSAQTATSVGTRAFFASPSQNVDVYDDATGSWSTLTLPTVIRLGPPSPVGGWGSATVGSKAVFTDGTHVDIYDDASGTWSSTMMPTPRYAQATVAVGTKVLFAGGRDVLNTNLVSIVEIYDTVTGTWSAGSLSAPNSGSPAASIGTRAFFCGGTNATTTLAIYDDAIGTFYCTPATSNSTGLPAHITAQGFPGSVVQGHALLAAAQLPQQSFGFFLTSSTQGLSVGPGGSQGDLCLGGAIGRYSGPGQIQNAGASGRFQLTLDLVNHPQPTGFVSVQSGETWNFQAWYRDANPGPTSNFTDAVSVTFL